MARENKESNYPKPMSFRAMVFWTGLFGGVFWGSIGYLAYLLGFTEIGPNVILEPWVLGYWKNEWIGTVLSLILMGMFSVGAAFVYYAVLKRFKGIWIGMGYGVVLFLFVFIVLNPFFLGMKPFFDLKQDTIVTSICLYIVYGLFIGYSINYEYQNNNEQEKEKAT